MVKEIMMVVELLIISYVLVDLGGFIGELIDMFIQTKNKTLGVIKSLLVYLLTCNKCFTFWFSLIMSGNLFIAAVVAILIVMVNKITRMLEEVKDL
jgi:type III secretory pathway component EscS